MDSHLRRPLRNRSLAGRRSEKGRLPGLLTSLDSRFRRSLCNRSPAERVSLKGHHPASETSLDSRFRGNDGSYAKVSLRGNDRWVGAGAGRVQPLTPVSGTGQAPALSHDGKGRLTYNGEGIPLDTQLEWISGKATSLRTSS